MYEFGPWAFPRAIDALNWGYSGVHLFLLLSGMCVCWPYVMPTGRRPFGVGEFLYRRFLRILPAYYVALAIALVVVFVPTVVALLDRALPRVPKVALIPAAIAAVILPSWAFYRAVERPLLGLPRWMRWSILPSARQAGPSTARANASLAET